ncbi:AAA family ATPase [Pseudactinotalea sp. Z1748]|uniref:AAA family ATPase n=1 Tax=Pseudactinotalea sp. Z1748 TaxID=3413027 RepID=UPI003C7CDD84
MSIKTRRPTGKAPWPMILLAGREKTGKSYSAAAFSASDLVDRTFYIEIGEGSADQYGALPGARYEIVEHDGSWKGILQAAQAAVDVPANGKPHAIVVDSMTELWGLLTDEQQAIADKRGKNTITMDQWNSAKKRWRKVIDTLRSHKGPVILTARFEEVTVMKDGKPTTDKQWKVRAEKDLPFEVDGTIELKEPRRPIVAGIRTVAFNVPADGIRPKDPEAFNLDTFFRQLNIDGSAERVYIPRKEDPDAHQPAPDAVRPDELPQEPALDDANTGWAGTDEEPPNA